jgi:hypothetical protein
LGVTIAHELVHIYNLYLQRGFKNHTPPAVKFGPYGNTSVGESGRHWEWMLFGGYIDMREYPEVAGGPGQARSRATQYSCHEVVGIRDGHNRYCWQVRVQTIQALLNRDFKNFLRRGTPLNDEDYPDGRITRRLNVFDWKQRFGDMFSQALPSSGPHMQQLSKIHLDRLTTGMSMELPCFNISGPDLRRFPFSLAVVPRFVSAVADA